MNIITRYMISQGWLELGYSGGILAITAYFRARPHLPNHHDGYVSLGGYVHNCTLCDRPPDNLPQQLARVRAYAREHPWIYPLSPQAEESESP